MYNKIYFAAVLLTPNYFDLKLAKDLKNKYVIFGLLFFFS